MEKRKDIMGNTPEIGDTIAFNPPYYKGLKKAKVIGFSKAGLPIISKGNDSPKTGFVIVKSGN